MPLVTSTNKKKLRLAAGVELDPNVETLVPKKIWKECREHEITKTIMRMGIITVKPDKPVKKKVAKKTSTSTSTSTSTGSSSGSL